MKRIKYVGPHDAVDVPAAWLEGIERNTVVEVPDELADALLEQVDNWQRVYPKAAVKPPRKRAAAKKSAAKPTAHQPADDENTEG